MRARNAFRSGVLAAAMAAMALSPVGARAEDVVRLITNHKGDWSTVMPLLGEQQGYFKAENIKLDITWSSGGSDAQQAIITGAGDIVIQTGTLGVLSAYEKGAPIRIIGAAMTGSGGLYWYVPKASPIKTFKDANGKTMAFSRPGSSTDLVSGALAKYFGVKVKRIPAGSPTAVLTQVMSGQIDLGWASAPVFLDKLQSGELRVVVKGDEAPEVRGQTIRVDAVNANWLKSHRDVATRFMRALWKSYEYTYTKQGMEDYSKMFKMPMSIVSQIPEYATLKAQSFWPPKGLDQTMKEAVQAKRLKKPLTKAQLDDLIQVVYKPKLD
ncbi:MAG TPA: ABC transporter substrate-binding protein [Alphaproteobacteria bacterium]|nr:ABC transporter substrate-binding protein [Alphaproteobacteria bacterium]